MKSKFKRALAVIASAAVMGNSLLASIPMAAYADDAGGIAGGDASVNIVNTSQGTDPLESIAINETNFPDEIFRTYVSDNFDTDNDGVLTPEEIAAVKKIDFYSADITTVADLTGVEHFTALTVLDCSDNKLTSLDVSKNTALTELWCTNNLLTSLDVSRNTALKHLVCYSNDLTSLDVSKNTTLLTLNCFKQVLM